MKKLTLCILAFITVLSNSHGSVVSLKSSSEDKSSIHIEKDVDGFNLIFERSGIKDSCFISNQTFKERTYGLLRDRSENGDFLLGLSNGYYHSISSDIFVFLILSPGLLATLPVDAAFLPITATSRIAKNIAVNKRIRRAFNKNKDLTLNRNKFNYFSNTVKELCSPKVPFHHTPRNPGYFKNASCEITRNGRTENKTLDLDLHATTTSSMLINGNPTYLLKLSIIEDKSEEFLKLKLSKSGSFDTFTLADFVFSNDVTEYSKTFIIEGTELNADCRVY